MWINTSTVWYQTDVMQPFSFLVKQKKKTHMSYLHVAPKEVFYGNCTKVILKMKSPLILLVYFSQRMSGLSLSDLYRVRAWRLIKVNLLPLGWSLHSALWHDDRAWSPTTLKHTQLQRFLNFTENCCLSEQIYEAWERLGLLKMLQLIHSMHKIMNLVVLCKRTFQAVP